MNTENASQFASLGEPPLLVLLIPFFITIIGTPIARDIALKLGIVDKPVAQSSKIHKTPIPYLGGVPFFAAVFTGTLIVLHQTSRVLPDYFNPWLILAAIAFVFLVGFWDDIRGMIPGTKMLLLGIAGTVLFFGGAKVTFIPEAWGIAGQVFAWMLTLFWILGITNSANLIDNMNGLSAGAGIVAGLSILAIATRGGDPVGIGLSLILVGGLLGYIPYNYPKAQIFFGDAGSITLGFFLSILGLLAGRLPAPQSFHPLSYTLGPILVMGLFVFDTFFVAFSRGKRKINFWWGGRDHTSHRFVNYGFSRPLAVALCWVMGLIFGIGGFAAKVSPWWLASLIAVALLAGGIWFGFLIDRIPVQAIKVSAIGGGKLLYHDQPADSPSHDDAK